MCPNYVWRWKETILRKHKKYNKFFKLKKENEAIKDGIIRDTSTHFRQEYD